uniref:Ribosomal protein L13A n=1 Tax=Cryptomonas curvata TaxID=233186 RepID=A0A7S0MVN5_9CRYP|nr:60S ribosomal protein L13A [Cryptomonas curvata]|mmetsp:Transcript_54528/g.113884  ORF Transcript_54528/g.113884 Transcript_54528/m.113884 type:complete len:194 (+) Transcript_54528:72-653(+)
MKNLYIIDGKGHLMGRLASICAKYLLNGTKIVVLSCEKIEISGKLIKNKLKYLSLYKKRTSTNPRRGPFHFKSPSQIFWKVIRGMLPHKTKRGSSALANLKVYEGVPPSYINIKKLVVPIALRILRLSPGRNYSKLGDISSEIGWTKKNLIEQLNDSRKIKNKLYYIEKTNKINKQILKSTKNRDLNLFYIKN